MKVKNIVLLSLLSAVMASAQAASVDGAITTGEYSWDTNTQNDYWNTHGGTGEESDGSGGDNWDIDYMGVNVDDGTFSFGIQGGSILGGENDYNNGAQTLWLGDLAIDINGDSSYDYGVILGINTITGDTEFDLYRVDEWAGVNRYNRAVDGSQGHVSDTYKIKSAVSEDSDGNIIAGSSQEVQDVNSSTAKHSGTGSYTAVSNTAALGSVDGYFTNGGSDKDGFVLEGSFDLSLLGLFDEAEGGQIITYLTMSCVNDEASVLADVSPVPVPAAFWLFGSALLGFIGFSRRTSVS